MSTADDEVNPYELLDVKLESSEAEIRTAYRQRSLKVHPDRVCFVTIHRRLSNRFTESQQSRCRYAPLGCQFNVLLNSLFSSQVPRTQPSL